MDEPEQPKSRPRERAAPARSAEIIRLDERFITAHQPDKLSEAEAIKVVRMLANDTDNIVVIKYGKRRARQRAITRRQIELCVQKGTLSEGPFMNQHGNWQLNLYRHAAGEELTCVVAIDWKTRVLVINTF